MSNSWERWGDETLLGTRARETGRDRDRIVSLSDGVFAIALTLLVLDIRVPDIPESVVASELSAELLAMWPKTPATSSASS